MNVLSYNDNDMNIVWWGECVDVHKVMFIDDNLAL